MKNFLFLTIAIFGVTSTFAAPSSSPGQDVQNLDRSRFYVDNAENYLKLPKTDLGGHRTKALAALSTAINEINAAIVFAKQHPGE